MSNPRKPTVDEVMRKYGSKIENKIGKNEFTPQNYSQAYLTFKEEIGKEFAGYEKWAHTLGKTIKINSSAKDRKKIDPLFVWYTVGKKINTFIKKNKIEKEEETIFWNQFYTRSTLIHKRVLSDKINSTRNDFRTACLLAKFPFKIIKKVGPWAMWREILTYKLFLNDRRILNWVIRELIKKPQTRDNARPFLKVITNRFKRMETTILSDKELVKKIKEIKIIKK